MGQGPSSEDRGFYFHHWLWTHGIQQRDLDTMVKYVQTLDLNSSEKCAQVKEMAQFLLENLREHQSIEDKYLFPPILKCIKDAGTSGEEDLKTFQPILDQHEIDDKDKLFDKFEEEVKAFVEGDKVAKHASLVQCVTHLRDQNKHHLEQEERIIPPLVEKYMNRGRQQEIGKQISTAARESGSGGWMLPAFGDYTADKPEERAKFEASMPWFVHTFIVGSFRSKPPYSDYLRCFPLQQ